jgi:hypothetical protein
MSSHPYQRRLSAEEASARFLFITKSALPGLPPVGWPFRLRVGERELPAAISAVPCACVSTPHHHYHLQDTGFTRLLPWQKGRVVRLQPVAGEEDLFELVWG